MFYFHGHHPLPRYSPRAIVAVCPVATGSFLQQKPSDSVEQLQLLVPGLSPSSECPGVQVTKAIFPNTTWYKYEYTEVDWQECRHMPWFDHRKQTGKLGWNETVKTTIVGADISSAVRYQ